MILYVVTKIENPNIINQEESGKKVSISFEFYVETVKGYLVVP
jgi:hypothetical protein